MQALQGDLGGTYWDWGSPDASSDVKDLSEGNNIRLPKTCGVLKRESKTFSFFIG
jgi:hypothetical protein